MGASKKQYQEIQETKQETHEIVDRLIETYGAEEALKFIMNLEKEKLNE